MLGIPRPASNALRPISTVETTGIKKNSSRNRCVTRHQRLRHEKGVARADCVRGQLESKLLKSEEKTKKVNERKKGWEDINESMGVKNREDGSQHLRGRFGILAGEAGMDFEGADITSHEINDSVSPSALETSALKIKNDLQPDILDEDEIL